eukprot:scaffold2585_cov368-Prasinococcus_capsulatus_cf.AAC.12
MHVHVDHTRKGGQAGLRVAPPSGNPAASCEGSTGFVVVRKGPASAGVRSCMESTITSSAIA